MPPPRGFARGDFDTSFPLDDRFQELAVVLSRGSFLQAVGAYWLLIASAWRDACRKPIERVAVGVPERVVTALVAVGLLDEVHYLPEGTFDRWVGSALDRRRNDADRKGREAIPTDSNGLQRTPTDSALARAPAHTVGPSRNGEERTKTGRGTPRQRVHAWLTEHGASAPVGWANTSLNEMVRVYGPDPILRLWTEAPADVRTSRQFVQYAERNLGSSGTQIKPKGLGPTTTEAEDAFTR